MLRQQLHIFTILNEKDVVKRILYQKAFHTSNKYDRTATLKRQRIHRAGDGIILNDLKITFVHEEMRRHALIHTKFSWSRIKLVLQQYR